ncbi:hypothetical protein QMY62_05840 [Xanthomonas campestris]|nr:hypothetical protein [Xanthomonas campestris]WHO93731.1 hypothetical protein QMY62_05840 [Xanthomonas campestris]
MRYRSPADSTAASTVFSAAADRAARRQHGFTLVLVTHDVAEASALADRIVVIEHGQVGLEVAVPAPHPRLPGAPAVAAIQAQVLSRLLGPPSPGAAAAAEAQPGAAAQVDKPLRRFA